MNRNHAVGAKLEALTLIDKRLLEVAIDYHNIKCSPYTGHTAYVVLCHARASVDYPDCEVYEGQRQMAESERSTGEGKD